MKNLMTLLAAACLIVGCSKDETPPPAEPAQESDEAALDQAPAPAAPAAPAQAAVSGDVVLQDLDSVAANLEGGDYDSAVTSLSAMQHVNLSPQQRQAYYQQLYNTQQYLLQKAQQDPAARDAYNRMSKQMLGR